MSNIFKIVLADGRELPKLYSKIGYAKSFITRNSKHNKFYDNARIIEYKLEPVGCTSTKLTGHEEPSRYGFDKYRWTTTKIEYTVDIPLIQTNKPVEITSSETFDIT